MKVSELIASRTEVYTLHENTTVLDAARYLREKRTRAVGIVNAQSKVVGVISQSDISDKVAAENKCPAWMHVSEIMSKDLESVGLETTLDECLRAMEKRGIFHLLVMDEKSGYHGIISVSDLLAAIVSDEKARADMLEAIMFGQR